MRAAVYTKHRAPEDVQIQDVERPVPKSNEVRIKVRAASVNPLDYHLKRVAPYLVRIPGRDVAGVVEAVGKNVTQFKAGDEVFGTCLGAFAEYACTSESRLVIKPDKVTFEQAASAPVAGYTALQGLRDKGRIQPGKKVLINGAAGGVGTFAVPIAKWLGAEVTAVCSTRNVDMVRSIGAHRVIDYTHEDFTQGAYRYDMIFDLVANHSLRACTRVLNPMGIYIGAGVLAAPPSMIGILAGLITRPVLSLFASQKFVTFVAKSSQRDLNTLGEIMATGKVTPIIDRRYTLGEVPEAIRYLAEGHARGKVIIAVQ